MRITWLCDLNTAYLDALADWMFSGCPHEWISGIFRSIRVRLHYKNFTANFTAKGAEWAPSRAFSSAYLIESTWAQSIRNGLLTGGL